MSFLQGLTVELQHSALRQGVLLQFEALKQHQAQQEASSARQGAGAGRVPERSTLQQQQKASAALLHLQVTSALHSSPGEAGIGLLQGYICYRRCNIAHEPASSLCPPACRLSRAWLRGLVCRSNGGRPACQLTAHDSVNSAWLPA